MRELITIRQNKDGTQAVSARDLYIQLGFNVSQWKRWYEKNITKNQFAIENEDWQVLDIMSRSKKTKDFALSLDFAKRLCMLARTEVGEKVRQYFIQCEKKAKGKTLPELSRIEILQLAMESEQERLRLQQENSTLSKENSNLKPKAELMDRVMVTNRRIDIGQAAKILELPFGRNTMFRKLREMGVFFKNKNEPKQSHITRGYFIVKQILIKRNNHPDKVAIKVLVTQKGLAYLSRLFDASPSNKQMMSIK